MWPLLGDRVGQVQAVAFVPDGKTLDSLSAFAPRTHTALLEVLNKRRGWIVLQSAFGDPGKNGGDGTLSVDVGYARSKHGGSSPFADAHMLKTGTIPVTSDIFAAPFVSTIGPKRIIGLRLALALNLKRGFPLPTLCWLGKPEGEESKD